MERAVIYCRVSGEEQVKNLSLPTQERLCREYCEKNNWQVVQVFVEKGESAKTIDRTAFLAALQFCHRKSNNIQYMVVYAISRFARNADDHIPVAAKLRQAGVKLRSATEPLDDSIVGRSMEVMLALFAEIDNRMRTDRTITGLKAAVEINRWPFHTPLGYIKTKDATGNSVVSIDPDRGSHITSAFNQFATGRYSKKQVFDDVIAQGLRTRKGAKLYPQAFDNLLRNPFYAGWLVVPTWGTRKRGSHQPLVDQETFDKVQAILAGRRPTVTPRQRNRPDFPLRGLINCGKCGAPMTAGWSKGRTKLYPYYFCSKRCKGMNHRSEKLEQQLLEVFDHMRMQTKLIELFKALVLDVWQEKQSHRRDLAAARARRVTELETRRQRLLDGYLEHVISAETFKEQSDKLEPELATVRTELAEIQLEELNIKELMEFTGQLVLDAGRFWRELPLDQKQRFLRVLTPDGIAVDENGLVRTIVSCPIFKLLQSPQVEKTNLVGLIGSSLNQIHDWLRQVEQLRQMILSTPATLPAAA
jgi:site-specific DNA recombinase